MVHVGSLEDQRRTERLSTSADVRVTIDAQEINGTLFDIGAGGAKVRLSQTIIDATENISATLTIPAFGEFDGKIAWIDGKFVGIQFAENHKALVSLIREATVQKTAA